MSRVLLGGAVLGAGVAAGIQLVFADVLVRGLQRLEPATRLRVHQEILDHRHHHRTVIPAVSLAWVTGVGTLIFGYAPDAASFWWAVVGILGLVAVTIATAAGNGPLNARVRSLEGPEDAANYVELFDAWIRWHRFRALGGCIAFVGFTAAVVLG